MWTVRGQSKTLRGSTWTVRGSTLSDRKGADGVEWDGERFNVSDGKGTDVDGKGVVWSSADAQRASTPATDREPGVQDESIIYDMPYDKTLIICKVSPYQGERSGRSGSGELDTGPHLAVLLDLGARSLASQECRMLKNDPSSPASAAMVKKKGTWYAHCVREGLFSPLSDIMPVVVNSWDRFSVDSTKLAIAADRKHRQVT
eukprot:1196342-Prorocentrum_minimum.AAC.3